MNWREEVKRTNMTTKQEQDTLEDIANKEGECLQHMKLKGGDVLECVYASSRHFTKGKQYKVCTVNGRCKIPYDDRGFCGTSDSRFKVVSAPSDQEIATPIPTKDYPNPLHKHKDVIIEWANGAEIETSADGIDWMECTRPRWNVEFHYRVANSRKQQIRKEIKALEEELASLD